MSIAIGRVPVAPTMPETEAEVAAAPVVAAAMSTMMDPTVPPVVPAKVAPTVPPVVPATVAVRAARKRGAGWRQH